MMDRWNLPPQEVEMKVQAPMGRLWEVRWTPWWRHRPWQESVKEVHLKIDLRQQALSCAGGRVWETAGTS